MTLNEVISAEFATVTAPLDEVVAYVVEHARVRPGFVELARERHPLVVSSGFHELIEPVLEREGVLGEVELRANRVEARPDGWRVLFRDVETCPVCGEPCKRARPAARARSSTPVTAIPTTARRSQPTASTRRGSLARYLDERGVAYEPLTDFRALRSAFCGCPSRSTSSSRRSASARWGPTSRTSGSTGRCTAWSAPRGADRAGARAGCASSRWTPRPRPSCASSSAPSSTSSRSTAGRRRAGAARADAGLAGFRPPLAPEPVRDAGHFDLGAAGLAARGVRDPEPADPAVRPPRRPGLLVPDREAACAAPRRTSWSPSASPAARPSTCSAWQPTRPRRARRG